VLVVVGNTVSWEDSWLDGGLAWLVGPLALESVSPWWLWSSGLGATGSLVSGANWLAGGCDPLIAGWKLSQTLSVDLNIICIWPWTMEPTNLSTIS